MASCYTLCVFSENSPGVLQRITGLFTRRNLNIESLTVSQTEMPGVSRFTIVIQAERELIEKVARQIHRIIEVSDVYVCENDELIFKEMAFYKVQTASLDIRRQVEELAHRHNAAVIFSCETYLVIEKTGTEDDVASLYRLLEPFGMREFVRSGRIALLKNHKRDEMLVTSAADVDKEAMALI